MSKNSISSSKATKIIAVAWALSLITNLSLILLFVIPQTQTPQTKTWHELSHVSGTFEETDPWGQIDRKYTGATITADNWRIIWRATCNQTPPLDNTFFCIFDWNDANLFPSTSVSKEDFRGRTGEWGNTKKGIEFFVGSGPKMIGISGAMVNWEMTIEEYY